MTPPGVDIIKLFGGNRELPKIKKSKNVGSDTKTCTK